MICFVLWIGIISLSAEGLLSGELSGKFTISEYGEYVHFSQGNLYKTKTNKVVWKFADTQDAFVGVGNKDGIISGKADLFGFSAENQMGASDFGASISISDDSYAGPFLDWGTKSISNGGGADVWSTLSKGDWEYLLTQRTNAASLYKICQVDTTFGLMLLPDDASVSISDSYTLETFAAFIETNDAVFLPFAARREGTSVDKVNVEGYYWTSTIDGAQNAYMLKLTKDAAPVVSSSPRHYGYAVRLVRRYDACTYNINAESNNTEWGTCSITINE